VLSARDSAGNRLSMRLVDGLPRGNVTTSLLANSTAAFENYLVTVGRRTVANVTVAYSVRYQDCQPAGLNIAIQGTADWGSPRSGILKVVMSAGPSRVEGDRASFDNSSAWASLGFDWSDGAKLNPVFDPRDHSVSWRVGGSFTVDPAIVATSDSGAATSDVGGLKECYANGRYWSWYYDGASVGFRSSADGGNWTSFTSVLPAPGAGTFSIYCAGATVYYAIASGPGTVSDGGGTMNPDGTITWGGRGSFATKHAGATGDPTTVVDHSGVWWVAVTTSDSGWRYIEVWRVYCAIPSSCFWTEEKDINTNSTDAGIVGSVLSLMSGVGVVYGAPGHPASVVTSADGGYSWGSPISTSGSCQSLKGSQFTSSGNSVYGVCDETSGRDTFLKFTLRGSSWTETALSSDDYRQTPLSTDGSRTLVAFEADDNGSGIYYFVSTDLGATWGPRQTLAANESGLQPFSATAGGMSNSIVALEWTAGSYSPYDVRFASFPPVVPDAAVSPNSWSKPGVSPYESYFHQMTEFVSPGNGLLTVEQDELALPGRGMGLTIGRVFSTPYGFRSASPYEYDNFTLADLGNGWSLNLPWLGANYLHLADGQAYPYRWNGNTFQVNNATNFELVHNGDGTYDLFLASGTDYRYAANESLLTITDRTGNNLISFGYSSGRISQIEDTIGRVVDLSYNANGQLSSISTGGRTWTYGYLGSNLVSATDPLGRVTRYEYNDGINRWLLTGIIYPTLGGATYAYGSAPVGTDVATYYVTERNAYSSPSLASLAQSVSTSYKITNGLITWANATTADGAGSAVGYESTNFQSSNALTRAYDKDASGTVVRVTEQDYDKSGRVNQTKMLSPSGALLASSQTAYDDWGNPTYTSDDLGHKAYFSYANTDSQNTFSAAGFSNSFYPSSTVPPNVHDALVGEAQFQNGPGSAAMETYYKYDPAGNLLESKQLHDGGWLLTDHTYDVYGNELSTTDALGRTTYFEYSPAYSSAYLTEQVTPVGGRNVTTSYTYDPATGNQLTQTDPNSFTTSYQYDALGRLTQTTYPAVSGMAASVRYSYDDAKNVLTTTNGNGYMTKQYYDGLGRLTTVERYNGSVLYSTESYTSNWDDQVATKTTAAGSVYAYAYDSFGRLTKTTNPDGTISTTSYDDANNVQTVTDENGHQTQTSYDWDGRLTAVREYYTPTSYYLTSYAYDQMGNLLSETDANKNATTYQYDDLNRVVKTTYPDGTYETRTYDSAGNLLTRTDPKGQTLSYAYDALNRLAKVTYPDSSSVSYTYDANGNRLSMVDSSFTTYYTYDARSRLTNETKLVAGSAYSLLYGYDQVGNVVSMTYPDGYALSLGYDAMNRVTKLGSGPDPFANFTYTLDDKVSTIGYGNGQVANYFYDSRDRPTQILVMEGTTKALDLNYTYDGTGNVLSVNNENYGYDALDRITSTSFAGGWGTINYTYDGAGNRLTMTEAGLGSNTTTRYSYGAFNRLASAASGSSATTTYAYDANGNLVAKDDGIHLWTYTYDYDNRLTDVQMGSQTVEQMVYDGGGRLTENVQGNNTVVSLWNGASTVFQEDLGTGLVTKYLMADGMQIAYVAGSTVYYSHEDTLGSVRLVSSSADATQFSSNYVPYGSNYKASGADVFQYAGKPLDYITGYYNFGSRWYDPSIGRFITQDSSSGNQADGESLDRYVYADNNPEKNVDPNGHSWLSAFKSTASHALGSLASAASNAWNSLPPPVQTVVTVAAVTGVIVATGGAAAPAILAGAAAMGGLSAAVSVGQEVASGQSVSAEAALSGFSAGFALGPVAMLAGGELTNEESTWTNAVPATEEETNFLT
jgi:RHS repeat-associated protein